MSRLGSNVQGVVSDDGLKLVGLQNPDGTVMAVSSIGLQPSASNFPNLRLSKNIVNTFRSAQGANALEAHVAALEQALEPLIASTAWSKIKLLWVPLGNGTTIASALQCIKYTSSGSIGVGAALSNTGFLASDYAPGTGLTGDGASKYLATGMNPATANIDGSSMSASNIGMAVHTVAGNTTGVLAATNDGGNSMYIAFNGSSAAGGASVQHSSSFPRSSRLMAVQANASTRSTELWNAGSIIASTPITGNSLPSAPYIFSQAGSIISNGTVTGFALFDALTGQEMDLLSRFFDQLNYLIGRNYLQGLVSLGDSIIYGSGLASLSNRFTTLVAMQLGLADNNMGQPGTTLSNLGAAPGYWAPSPLGNHSAPPSSALINFGGSKHGCLYILEIGINDSNYAGYSLAKFTSDHAAALAYLKALGVPMQNVLCLGFFNSDFAAYGWNNQANINAQNGIVQASALAVGAIFVPLLDLWAPTQYATYLDYTVTTPYGIHPNIAGHNLIHKRIMTVLAAQFPLRTPANTNFLLQSAGVS